MRRAGYATKFERRLMTCLIVLTAFERAVALVDVNGLADE